MFTDQNPQYVSTPQAAALIGCARVTVVSLIQTGKLRAHKVAKHYRIRRDDIDAFLAAAQADVVKAPASQGGDK